MQRERRWRTARQVDGHRVGLTVAGEGPPVVLLHGVGRDRTDFAPVFDALAASATVYAIDIEGFGWSEPWGDRVTLASMAAMVRRTLAAAGERRRAVLVGNSMGGAVALRMAADDPAAVAGLVLVSPAGFGREAVFGLRLMTVPVLAAALLRFDEAAAFFQVRVLFPAPPLRSRAMAHESARRMKRRGMRRSYLQAVHDLGAWSGIRPGWRAEVLAALVAHPRPTLVLWGDRDGVLPHAHLAAAAAALPFAETRSLPGLGHAPQMEDPDAFLAAVRPFLARLADLAGLADLADLADQEKFRGSGDPRRHAVGGPPADGVS